MGYENPRESENTFTSDHHITTNMFGIETFIVLVVCSLCYILLKKRQDYWKQIGIPFEKPVLLFGNTLDILRMKKSLSDILRDLYFKYSNKRFFGIWVYHEPHLVLRCPELIKQVLIKDFDNFYNRNVQSNEKVDPITANMMFFTKNPKWRFIRTSTTPMFSSGKLKYIYPQIEIVAKELVSFVSEKNPNILFLKNITSKYSTDVISSIAFGIDSHSFQDNDTPFTDVGKGVFEVSLRNTTAAATYFSKNPFVDLFRIRFVKASIANFLSDTFLNIIKERRFSEVQRRDLVDLMIELKEKHKFADNELIGQATQFFLAGYETTSTTITFALYELSLNKEVQSKLRNEIDKSIENGEKFSYYTLKNVSYLHQVVLETLRKYPPLPFLGRSCTNDYKIPGSNITIEKDTPVMIPLMGIHYDPVYFPDPQKFDPERFSEGNFMKIHPGSFLPFGDGPRNCIGQRIGLLSVKLALAHFVRNFEFEAIEGTEVPITFSPKTFTLTTNNPIGVHIRKLSENRSKESQQR
ncbi:Cyp6g1 [Trypoxylus dichotomus]